MRAVGRKRIKEDGPYLNTLALEKSREELAGAWEDRS